MVLDQKGMFLVNFLEKGATINLAVCCETVEHLWAAISNQVCWQKKGMLLLHDNALPYMTTSIQEFLQHFWWNNLGHLLYSPNLATRNVHLSQLSRNILVPQISEENVETVLTCYSNAQDTFYEMAIKRLVLCLDKCLKCHGDYMEN